MNLNFRVATHRGDPSPLFKTHRWKSGTPTHLQISRKSTRAAFHRGVLKQKVVNERAWDKLIAATPSLVIFPEPDVNLSECSRSFADDLAEMDYAIDQAATQMATEPRMTSASEAELMEPVSYLRVQLFNFIRNYVLHSDRLLTMHLWSDGAPKPKGIGVGESKTWFKLLEGLFTDAW